MNTYQSLSAVAHNLRTSESELLDLERQSWIRRVAKNGSVFLSGRDAYKTRSFSIFAACNGRMTRSDECLTPKTRRIHWRTFRRFWDDKYRSNFTLSLKPSASFISKSVFEFIAERIFYED